MTLSVCHLIDSNVDTKFFASISRLHNRETFPVMIGSIAPPGPLQTAMVETGTPTFSLNTTARWQYPAAVMKLAAMLRRRRVGIVHAHCFDPTLVGLFGARLAGIPFVFTRHHSDHHVRMGLKWHIRIDGWCARRADRVIAVSEATRRVMMEAEHVPDSQITVVYNGMEPLEPPAPASVERVREELQLGPTPVCLMLARFHPEKGHDVLLDAIPALLARKGPVTILLAGDGAYRQVIEQGVRSRGLTGAVRFLGQRKDIAELISLANVVVLPSLAESFGYAALEAMSLGRPVVATTAGGLPEVVAGGETGLLVPPGDSAALAEALFKVLHSHDLAKQMGNAGAARSIRFGFQAMIRGYESVYDGLLRERAAGKSYSRSQSGETSPRFATKDGRRP